MSFNLKNKLMIQFRTYKITCYFANKCEVIFSKFVLNLHEA